MSTTFAHNRAQRTRPQRRFTLRSLRPGARVCLGIVILYALAGFVGPVFISFDAQTVSLTDRLLPPFSHTADGGFVLAGTDQLGRQILPQLIYGARVSLIVGILVLGIAAVFGLIVGTISGYLGGKTDAVIMRIADIQLSIPGIVLAILIIAVLGPGVTNIVVTLAFAQWPIFARLVRGIALTLREQDFVLATRLMGASRTAVITKCILPECLPSVAVLATANLGQVVVAEAALSFLGLGLPADAVSWGSLISDGRSYLPDKWWISTIPGVVLVILVLCASTIGDAIGDLDSPSRRARRTENLTVETVGGAAAALSTAGPANVETIEAEDPFGPRIPAGTAEEADR